MNHYATIRAALESIRTCDDDIGERDAALSALAELEKSASEPALTRHSLVMVPVTPTDAMINAACYLLPGVPRVCMDDAIERAIAAAPPVPDQALEITARADAEIAEWRRLLGDCRQVIAWEYSVLDADPRGRESEHAALGALVQAIDTARGGE
jgi:hypothetical protein